MTPTDAKVLQDAIKAKTMQINTAIPARVVRVDKAKDQVDVQPYLKRKYATGDLVDLPVITNVPIATYRAGKALISLPVKSGDSVLLIFSQRSLDRWLAQGGSVDPADPRAHHYSDAIAYPGVYPFTDSPIVGDPDNLVIVNDKSRIVMQPGGKMRITDSNEELIDLMSQLCQAILDARTNTILGPQPLINLMDQFNVIKSKLNTMKG